MALELMINNRLERRVIKKEGKRKKIKEIGGVRVKFYLTTEEEKNNDKGNQRKTKQKMEVIIVDKR